MAKSNSLRVRREAKIRDLHPLFLQVTSLFVQVSSRFLCEFRKDTPIHRSEIHNYELKGLNGKPCNQLLESTRVQIRHLINKTLSLDEHDTSQRPKFLINGGTILPFLFKKLPSGMTHSILDPGNPLIPWLPISQWYLHNQDNWLNPVKPFHRSWFISSFYKANGLWFLNDPHPFWFYCTHAFAAE